MKQRFEDTESPTLTALLTRGEEPVAAGRGTYDSKPLFPAGIALAPLLAFEPRGAAHQTKARLLPRALSRE